MIKDLDIFQVSPNPKQPRKDFAENELQQLANSIAEHGVISPIIVRPVGNEKYEIIAGERRWRASIIAKQETIPAIIRDLDDLETNVFSIIENIQREDLNPIEEALAYQQLQNDYQLSHQDIAQSVGKSRSTITNTLRILKLPQFTQNLIRDESITIGHAKLLMSLVKDEDIIYISGKIAQENLSIKQTQFEITKLKLTKREKELVTNDDESISSNITMLEELIMRQLSTKVKIHYQDDGNGFIKIYFYDLDDFERICDQLEIDITN